jgi:hypothetical protein
MHRAAQEAGDDSSDSMQCESSTAPKPSSRGAAGTRLTTYPPAFKKSRDSETAPPESLTITKTYQLQAHIAPQSHCQSKKFLCSSLYTGISDVETPRKARTRGAAALMSHTHYPYLHTELEALTLHLSRTVGGLQNSS